MAERAAVTVTKRLADFTVGLKLEDLAVDVVMEAKKGILDTIGVALAGSTEEATQKVWKVYEGNARGDSTVLGTTIQTAPTVAAMVNGYAAHVLDYDDTQHNCGTHMSSPVLPAALVIAEMQQRSGKDLLEAYVAGFEVGCRLARVAKYGRVLAAHGVHATGFLGHIGSVAAAGRLAGLNASQIQHGFGIAASQAAGLMRSFGTMCKGLNAGSAAQDAVLSVLLAKQGFTGPDEIFDGKQNLFTLVEAEPHAEELMQDLGKHFEIVDNTLKIFACAGWRNPILEAMIHIATTHKLQPKDLAKARILAWTNVMQLPNYSEPRSGLEGKFSAQYAAAVALADRAGGKAQFSDERVGDPELAKLTRKITLEGDAALGPYQIRLVVHTVDGRELTHFIPAQKGDPRNPLTWDELATKFRSNAAPILPAAQVERLAEMVHGLEKVAAVSELTRLCQPGRA